MSMEDFFITEEQVDRVTDAPVEIASYVGGARIRLLWYWATREYQLEVNSVYGGKHACGSAEAAVMFNAVVMCDFGWKIWGSGKSPVNPDTQVDYMLRDGSRGTAKAGSIRWMRYDGDDESDIIAYRRHCQRAGR